MEIQLEKNIQQSMKRLDLYLIRQFLTILGISILGFTCIFLIVDLIENLDRFIDNTVPWNIVSKYYVYTVPWFFNIALPMAMLIATVFSVGLLVKRNEWTAMKSSGISLYRVAIPLIIIGVIISYASFEFEKMRKRIIRHLNQRSEMLSGISHDLRTPLTRIKLQLSFIKDKEISKKLSDDVEEMEKMLNEYLQFASSRSAETTETFDLSELLETTIMKYEKKEITTDISKEVFLDGRKNLMQRCFSNLIDNAIKYSTNVYISLRKLNNNILITIDDDGPGIPENERENVFKPFYKIDKSRGDSKSSVGLGLSIASDIVKSHGGNIKLETSPTNGLRIKVILPF